MKISYGCKVLDPELQGTYAGGCVNGLADGSGEATGTARYQGAFKAGKKHGKGVKTWPDTGDRYEGDFVEDRKQGAGTYVWGSRSAWATVFTNGAPGIVTAAPGHTTVPPAPPHP